MGKLFGTDGVRGIANKDLTPELAFKLGRIGGYFLTKGKNHNKFREYKFITISYDILKAYDDSISSARADVFNKYINDKKDLLEFGNGKWHTIIATGSHGKSI